MKSSFDVGGLFISNSTKLFMVHYLPHTPIIFSESLFTLDLEKLKENWYSEKFFNKYRSFTNSIDNQSLPYLIKKDGLFED